MAKTITEDLICDICGTKSRVTAYTIVAPEGAAVIDLCTGDAKPLVKLWQAGNTGPRQRVDKRTQTGHAVIPVD
jgi:hypothetical protein